MIYREITVEQTIDVSEDLRGEDVGMCDNCDAPIEAGHKVYCEECFDHASTLEDYSTTIAEAKIILGMPSDASTADILLRLKCDKERIEIAEGFVKNFTELIKNMVSFFPPKI